jgi:serine/threonine-protein kinase
LPEDKCSQITRQLCSGLAAAHDKGLLHRDLKPANVMVDGRGNVRITDFGLAAPADQLQGKELRAGTPAYMSPEQLLGREITVRSDIYSLGLVLYEIFTGKQAFEAPSFSEYVRLHHHELPQSPATHFTQIDPIIETVIMRCLEKDPARRFPSAIAVAAAMPGGDPLAAALAAGETPSPEMVAAAGGTSGLKAPLALALLAVVAIGMLAIILLASRSDFLNRLDLEEPPLLLKAKSQTLIAKLGYHEPALDTASGYSVDFDFYQYEQNKAGPHSWDTLASGKPGPVYYWYRQSPKYLVSPSLQGVAELDPPLTGQDMIRLELDPKRSGTDPDDYGRLLELEVVPKSVIPPAEPVPITGESPGTQTQPQQLTVPVMPVDWEKLFVAAGLSFQDYVPASPTMTPPDFAEVRAAWVRKDSDRTDLPARVEAAGFQGKPTFFKLQHGWEIHPKGETDLDQLAASNLATNRKVRSGIILALLLAAAFMAFRNITSGRADRNGAQRLAFFFGATGVLSWALHAHHVADFLSEFFLFTRALGEVLYPSIMVWAFYLALEPYVRRIWPETLISWSRLLSGRVLDPLIGRHVVFGSVAGVACVLLYQLERTLPPVLGLPNPLPLLFRRVELLSISPLSTVLTYIHNSMYVALFLLLLLVILRTGLRKRLLAGIVFVILVTCANTALVPGAYVSWAIDALISIIYMVLLIRFGLVSLVTALLFYLTFTNIPLTPNLSIWYADISLYAVAATGALASAGAYIAIASRSTFRPPGLTRTSV